MAINIHPSVDNGVKPGNAGLRRRHAHLQVHAATR